MKNTIIIITTILVLAFWGCEEPDTTPPDISITSPVNGAVVSDSVTIKTVVADNEGISNVEFYLDGDLLTTVSEEPFETNWNTSETTNGAHTLQCKAVDNSDNETLSESIQVTVANALFTANFTNDWLCADCGEGILFISDMDGNVLAEATWTGNDSFEIEAPEGIDAPERISVTTVVGMTEWGNVFLTTYLDIPVGSSWTWGNYYQFPDYDNPTTVEFDFQNIPDHSGYSLSDLFNSRSSNTGTLNSPFSFDFFDTPPVDIYLKLNTTNSIPQFLWLNDISGGNYQIDLSNMSVTESHTIDLQENSVSFFKYLYGYPTPGSRNTGRYRLDYGYDFEQITSSINVYYPPSTFTDFRTILFFYDSDDASGDWYQAVFGDIPNTFDKVDADFEWISISPDNFQISTTSTNFDEIRSQWEQDGDNYYYWYFYGPNDLTSYSLPNLPNSVLNTYPDMATQSFEMVYARLIDHSELDSYEDKLDILFNSSDYFYNVVNDYRSRTKYYDSGRSANFSRDYEMEDEYYRKAIHR